MAGSRALVSGRKMLADKRMPSRIGARAFNCLRIAGGRDAADKIVALHQTKRVSGARTMFPNKGRPHVLRRALGAHTPLRAGRSPSPIRLEALTITWIPRASPLRPARCPHACRQPP